MLEIQLGEVVAGSTSEVTYPKDKFSDVDFTYARASCPKCVRAIVHPNNVTIILTPTQTKGPHFKLLNLYSASGDQVNTHPIVVRWTTI